MKYVTFIFILTCVSCTRKSQIDNMLADRPEMNLGDSTSIVYTKAEKILQDHDWDSLAPEQAKRSEFTFDNKIRIRKGMTSSESWAVFFYESYNIENRKRFKALYEKALREGMTRREWVLENATLEHDAADKFVAFAEDTLIPYLESRGIETSSIDSYITFFKVPVESWMLSDENSYPWNYWGAYYDKYLK
jgi:hypothetical protein